MTTLNRTWTRVVFTISLCALSLPAEAQTGACQVGARVTDRQDRSGVVVEAGASDCHVLLDDGTRRFYLAWMLRPAEGDPAPSAGSGTLPTGTYQCWAAGGVAGTLRLVIRNGSEYADRDGTTGTYGYDAQTKQITFHSGPWEGFYGALLEPRKIGIASRPGGFYNTVCDLE